MIKYYYFMNNAISAKIYLRRCITNVMCELLKGGNFAIHIMNDDDLGMQIQAMTNVLSKNV